ncbi:hypothetical protein OESDEN_12080 [Oesophagostomum dentatum]|uniref:Uncharacterized protein n=1 Tax=Oesophagostomum dentatum TaxID=61180 RepID=A0A0B1SS83_OESDE|nr:hypothetical protein OESDEN_12080 [Oesophagostomum dentatum]
MRHGRLLLPCYLTTLLILTGIEAALGFDISRTQVRQIDFTKQLQPATKCAEGRIASYEYELDPKAVTFVEGMYCFCQVIIFHKSITEPDYGREAKWKLYDVIARPAYVPIGHFRGVTPFCVTGQRTTVCFCSGNGCFWDAWSVVDFLLQTYRYNIGGEAEKLKNYRFDDYKDDKKFRINALHSVTSGLRKSFQFG